MSAHNSGAAATLRARSEDVDLFLVELPVDLLSTKLTDLSVRVGRSAGVALRTRGPGLIEVTWRRREQCTVLASAVAAGEHSILRIQTVDSVVSPQRVVFGLVSIPLFIVSQCFDPGIPLPTVLCLVGVTVCKAQFLTGARNLEDCKRWLTSCVGANNRARDVDSLGGCSWLEPNPGTVDQLLPPQSIEPQTYRDAAVDVSTERRWIVRRLGTRQTVVAEPTPNGVLVSLRIDVPTSTWCVVGGLVVASVAAALLMPFPSRSFVVVGIDILLWLCLASASLQWRAFRRLLLKEPSP